MSTISPRILAFYLPQFHPIPENDKWWGKGFTEWTNVGKAKPLFRGHDQPRVPTELGYYDLRLPSVREQQAQLAKEAGIEGFVYWHYWFGNGKTLMADVFNEVLTTGNPDFPFALGWANHSWFAKTWNNDGSSKNTLLAEQTYPGENDARIYFESLLPAFKDKRYIKVNGCPLFYVFDPVKLPESYIHWFKKWTVEEDLPGLYLVANIVDNTPKKVFLKRGFDAVTYQRLSSGTPKFINNLGKFARFGYQQLKKIKGFLIHRPPRMEDYSKASRHWVTEAEKEIDVIPSLLPQWDHSPRSGWNGLILVNSSPAKFKAHAKEVFSTLSNKPKEQQIVFLKSWNEWGEGNYMEPDMTHGRGYITALREAIDEARIQS